MAETGFFDAPNAHLTPTADGHVFDEGAFVFGGGFEVAFESGDEVQKSLAVFVIEDYGLGEDAVAEAVFGRFAFSSERNRTAGAFAVGLRGEDAGVGTHTVVFSIMAV